MRLVHYYVIEKATGKKVFVHCKPSKCYEHLATLENKDNYFVGQKWLSI